jgi:hypothetical protein
MKTSRAGKILVALAFASMIGGVSVGTALGDENSWRQSQQNRGEHGRDRRDNGSWRGNGSWHDNGGWRDNRGGWHAYQPVYVPPPVIYHPSASPGISLFFPFFR